MDTLAAAVREVYDNCSGIYDISSLQHFDRPGSYGDRPTSPRYFDFLSCMEQVATPDRQAEIEMLIGSIVVWKAATSQFMTGYNGFDVVRHSGLTTYIEQECFPQLNAAYRRSAWWQATRAATPGTD